MNINLHIEQLILDGLEIAPHQHPLVQAAVETELIRLLAVDGLAPHWLTGGAVPRVSAEAIQLRGDHNPTHLGQQIARAVYGGIGR